MLRRSKWGGLSRWAQHGFAFMLDWLRRGGRLSPTDFHDVISFTLPLLVALVALKHHGKVFSPFETHPLTMQFAIVSLLCYGVAYRAQLSLRPAEAQLGVQFSIYGRFMEFFGSLSLVLLASIFFPGPVKWVFFASCAIGWTADSWCSLLIMAWEWMRRTAEDKLRRQPPAPETNEPQASGNDSNEEIVLSVIN